MKNEILDAEDEYDKFPHSTQSFYYFLYSFSIVAGLSFFAYSVGLLFLTSMFLRIILLLLAGSSFVASFLGIRSSIISSRTKEGFNWKTFVGGMGNIVLFIFFVYILLFLIIDFF